MRSNSRCIHAQGSAGAIAKTMFKNDSAIKCAKEADCVPWARRCILVAPDTLIHSKEAVSVNPFNVIGTFLSAEARNVAGVGRRCDNPVMHLLYTIAHDRFGYLASELKAPEALLQGFSEMKSQFSKICGISSLCWNR